MPQRALTRNEQRAVTSAGLASVVLMFMVWWVLPRLNALAFAPGEILPLPIRLFRACYAAWPFILLAAAVIGVLLPRLDPAGPWRSTLLILDWLLAVSAIALIGLGIVAAYLPVFLLPGRI